MALSFAGEKKLNLPTASEALPGRSDSMQVPNAHHVLQTPLQGPWPDSCRQVVVALGCFWGAERKFWQLPGVYSTAVGYAGGYTPNPTYEEVCSGRTGHTEVVLVVFEPAKLSYSEVLKTFWESHNPTQGMRQGNDRGSQYRSAIYTYDDEQLQLAEKSKEVYGRALLKAGYDNITTEIRPAQPFYYAEHYHQQYLAKVPDGYCGLGGTGVGCNMETLVTLNQAVE